MSLRQKEEPQGAEMRSFASGASEPRPAVNTYENQGVGPSGRIQQSKVRALAVCIRPDPRRSMVTRACVASTVNDVLSFFPPGVHQRIRSLQWNFHVLLSNRGCQEH